jgi:hypothetical protein
MFGCIVDRYNLLVIIYVQAVNIKHDLLCLCLSGKEMFAS